MLLCRGFLAKVKEGMSVSGTQTLRTKTLPVQNLNVEYDPFVLLCVCVFVCEFWITLLVDPVTVSTIVYLIRLLHIHNTTLNKCVLIAC